MGDRMETCDSGHEVIVHASRRCPLCAEIDKSMSLKDQILDLREQLNDATIEELAAKSESRNV